MADLLELKKQMKEAKERAEVIESEIEEKMKILPGKDINHFQNKVKNQDREVSIQSRHSK
jgi:hypothetical protein